MPISRYFPGLAARLAPVVLAVALATTLGGCAGPTFVVQQYAGAVRPRETIATLRVNGNDSVRLTALDDEDLGALPVVADSRLHIELLPGKHSVSVLNASAPHDPPVPITFQGEQGKVYRVAFVAGAPHVYEVDRSSDALGTEVTKQP